MRATSSAIRCAMAITGGVEPFDMDQMMELDMEVHHHDAMLPITCALHRRRRPCPDSASSPAVLGVVIHHGRSRRPA